MIGGLLGGLGGAAAEGIAKGISKPFSTEEYINGLSVWDQVQIGLHSPDWRDALARIQAREVESLIVQTKLASIVISLPDIVFSGLDAVLLSTPLHPDW